MTHKMLVHILKKVNKIDWLNRFESFCPWLDMAETERSRAYNLRSKIFRKLEITESTVTCWVTCKHVKVKNAHILPDSTKNKIMQRLQLKPDFRNDVDAEPSNFMILDVCLENAFDSMKISFAPADLLHTEVLRLKIWDSNCKEDPVEVGTDAELASDLEACGKQRTTIGDYDGFPLNVPATWRVSRRALSYHTLCCYIYQKYKGNLSIGEDEPADFSSQTTDGRDKVRKELAELFQSSIREDEYDIDDHIGELDYDDAQEVFNDHPREVSNDHPIRRRNWRGKCVVM
jgi:hypothetical protein